MNLDNSENPSQAEEPVKRLIISQMKLHNFKSYVGTQTIGPFHKSFSAVVGPNGSGKSNVIDSLLFVFGYRANKMRQSKLSELIHTSKQHHSLDSCSVEVHFIEILDSGATYETIPGTELVIRRTAYRNNSSRYFINDVTSSYTEVTDLLRDRGIDLDHKRFLILQGEVESIAQMKPKALSEHDEGLLEYLEDIIGTSQFKDPIEKASVELERTTEERQEKATRLKYVEKEKNNLEAKKLEAEAYIKAENAMIQKKHIALQIKRLSCNRKIEKSTKALEALKIQLEEEEAKVSEVKKESKMLEKTHKSLTTEIEQFSTEAEKTAKEMERLSKEDAQFVESRKFSKKKVKKLAAEIDKNQFKVQELETWLRNSEQDHEKALQELKDYEVKLAAAEKQLGDIAEALKDKTEVFTIQIDEKERQLAPWTDQINHQQSQIEVFQSKLNLIKSKREEHARQLEAYKQELKELKTKKDDAEKVKLELANELRSLASQLEDKHREVQDLRAREEALTNRAREKRQRFSEAQASAQSARSRGKVLDALLREKELGRLRGIHGRLGNLGVIDAKYDVAISTACPQLNYIVVDTIKTAQECTKFLRDNQVGRGVFMPLDRIQAPSEPFGPTPQNLPRLYDLVKPKQPEYARAFLSVLRETLVADNLRQAREVGMGKVRRRVVTLAGELVETAGTMTGGGKNVSRGGMGSQFVDEGCSPETLAAMKKEADMAEQALNEFRVDLRRVEAELENVRNRRPQIETQLSKLEMDIDSMSNQARGTQQRHEQLSKTNALSPRDISDMEKHQKDIDASKERLTSLRKSAGAIQTEIQALQSKILQVGGVQLRGQSEIVESIKQQMELVSQKLEKAIAARSKNQKEITLCNNSQVKAVETKAQEEANVAKYEAKIIAIQDSYKELSELSEASANEINKRESELEAIQDRRQALLDAISQWRTLEVDLKNQIDDSTRSLGDSRKHLNHWQAELDKLTLQPLADEEFEEDKMEVDGEEAIGLVELGPHELDEINAAQMEEEIAMTESKLKSSAPNLGVLSEYRVKLRDFRIRQKELDDATALRDEIKSHYDALRQERLSKFMEGFSTISYKLKEMYQMITLGGNAELELVDSLDPFSEGIIFSVMPPKKSWKNISNLSGGEKTLSSLALVFALHHFKPTPLYVMDEIDAALDFRNVSIVANYIKERTRDAQFIIISLRNNMFELADRLVGIYKTHDCTKSITLDPTAITMHSA
ncbi:Structural maintenance of chromosomes protein 4 [Entomophthora muscae]|uniref:Structural maintenance of chromosomes protein 4 n=2 Tax=Entomophthora muscae TaxID=34485 RepID=A0ACC2SH29_9FUNG|nr:Structural maintenance of chromosomes protein 4 [Entomophthora muscae]